MIVCDLDKTVRDTTPFDSMAPIDTSAAINWVDWQNAVNTQARPYPHANKLLDCLSGMDEEGTNQRKLCILTSSQSGTKDWLKAHALHLYHDHIVERNPGDNRTPREFKLEFAQAYCLDIELWVDDDHDVCSEVEKMGIPVLLVGNKHLADKHYWQPTHSDDYGRNQMYYDRSSGKYGYVTGYDITDGAALYLSVYAGDDLTGEIILVDKSVIEPVAAVPPIPAAPEKPGPRKEIQLAIVAHPELKSEVLELEHIFTAIDQFSQRCFYTMAAKVAEGKKGWSDQYAISKSSIAHSIFDQLKTPGPNAYFNIANYCMIMALHNFDVDTLATAYTQCFGEIEQFTSSELVGDWLFVFKAMQDHCQELSVGEVADLSVAASNIVRNLNKG